MTDPNQEPNPWTLALQLAQADHDYIWTNHIRDAAVTGWRDEMQLVRVGLTAPNRPGEPPDWWPAPSLAPTSRVPGDLRAADRRRRHFQQALQCLIHVEWPLGLIAACREDVRADVHAKRFILRDSGMFLWTEFGWDREWGPLSHAADVGEGLVALDGRAPVPPVLGAPLPDPPEEVADHLRRLTPADDWWWNWEEHCLRSYLLRHLSPDLWAADELRDHLRRMLRTEPYNEAIEIGADADGQPLARYQVPRIGNIVFQGGALRYEHRCDSCGSVYSPPITGFEGLGWALKVWEVQLHER